MALIADAGVGGKGYKNTSGQYISGQEYSYINSESYLKSLTSDSSKNIVVTPPQYPIVNAPFIKLDIPSTNATGITSLSWRGNAPDYFTSLSHKRILKQACQCTLNLSYVPAPGEDPCTIEAAIWDSKGKCRYQYGLTGYQSPVYSGLIYDYSVQMSEGRLDYKMDLISQEVAYLGRTIKDESFNIPSIKERQKSFSTRSPDIWVATLIRRIITTYLDNAFIFEDCVYNRETHTCPYDLQSSHLELVGENPLQALQKIVKHLYPKNSKDSSILYYLVFDDETTATDSKCKIKLLSTENVADAQSVVKTYSFLWNHRESSVLSWAPQYKGTAVIFNENYRKNFMRTENSSFNLDNLPASEYGFQTSDGSYLVSTIPNKSTLRTMADADYKTIYGSDFEDVIERNDEVISAYRRMAKYPYKANMTVMGLPADYVVGAHILVQPYLNGVLHHTAGEYMVLGIQDNVSGSGFTTDLELVRVDVETDIGAGESARSSGAGSGISGQVSMIKRQETK